MPSTLCSSLWVHCQRLPPSPSLEHSSKSVRHSLHLSIPAHSGVGPDAPAPSADAACHSARVCSAASAASRKMASPLLNRPTRKVGEGPKSLWAETMIRSSVLDAEAERPGGLDGAPGEIKPADIHTLLEARWGRKLTREEKQFANERLSYNIMQLQPPSCIRSYIFLGNAYNAVNFWELRSLGITHVLNLCAEGRFDPPRASYEAAGIECHRISLIDAPSQDILPSFEESRRILDDCRAGGGVCLVHCEYGVSRSGTIVIAYLMGDERLSLRKAYEAVRAERDQVRGGGREHARGADSSVTHYL